MTVTISFYGEQRNRLGECPLWDGRSNSLYWVDGVGKMIYCADADGRLQQQWPTHSMVGSIGLAENGLVVALEDGFYSLDTAGGDWTPLARPEAGNHAVRFNDGKADRQGRFLAGTMRHGGADGAPGKLYRLNHDGRAEVLETGIMLSNGLCFSPGGETLYFADSLQSCIYAYDYAVDGRASNRRLFRDTADLGSAPDGATADAEGCLWVALVQADMIVRLDTQGKVMTRIPSPIPYPSCPAFGGAGLASLFVTSLSDTGGMFRTDHPDGGRTLRIDNLGVTGIAEPVCNLPVGASS